MFFETERSHFFRPLSGKHREVIVASLRALYERLHGPSADYAQNLSRDGLRDLLLPVVREARRLPAPDDAADLVDPADTGPALIPDHADDLQGGAAVARALQRDGWVEAFPDRAGLVTAYRLTRAGKLFAEAFWSLERRSSRTRQRNVRSGVGGDIAGRGMRRAGPDADQSMCMDRMKNMLRHQHNVPFPHAHRLFQLSKLIDHDKTHTYAIPDWHTLE